MWGAGPVWSLLYRQNKPVYFKLDFSLYVVKQIPFMCGCNCRDAENQEIKKQTSIATERISLALANLTFFDIELGAISKESYESQLKASPLLKKHKPYMDKIRKNAKYQLSESVETILTKVSPFMSSEWDDMMDEMETKLEFKLGRKNIIFQKLSI